MKPEQSTSALIAIFKDALNHSNETPALKYKRGIPDAAIDASLKILLLVLLLDHQNLLQKINQLALQLSNN